MGSLAYWPVPQYFAPHHDGRKTESGYLLPAIDPEAAKLLGIKGLRHSAAL
jgi:hypothetical protein